jgi:hypothetical protein
MSRLKFQDKKFEDMTYSEILEYGKNGKPNKKKLKLSKKH